VLIRSLAFTSLASLCFVFAACSEETTSTAPADAGADSDAGGFPFKPTNVEVPTFSGVGAVQLDEDQCKIDGETGKLEKTSGPVDPKTYTFAKVKQADGSEIAVFTMKSLTVDESANVAVFGALPVVLVAEEDVNVQGVIALVNYGLEPTAGGGSVSSDGNAGGPGGGKGGASDGYNAGGGGAYCGHGGKGNGVSTAEGGATYGKPEISPLVAGSAGANSAGGRGGGAIQIVAGKELTIGAKGAIAAPGKGGGNGGGGGGSGGAILLESSKVTISGKVAANGGGGSVFGEEGTPPAEMGHFDDVPAAGVNTGGKGGAGAQVNGGDGAITAGDPKSAGGGGGGAGRIRINTATGSATVTGVVSPSLGSECGTQGKVAPR
jgi:hypothetical protein